MSLFFRKRNNLKMVYEDDLIKYLKSIGLYDGIKEGKYLCTYCGNKITLENLEVIIPKDMGGVEIVCSNKNCLNQI